MAVATGGGSAAAGGPRRRCSGCCGYIEATRERLGRKEGRKERKNERKKEGITRQRSRSRRPPSLSAEVEWKRQRRRDSRLGTSRCGGAAAGCSCGGGECRRRRRRMAQSNNSQGLNAARGDEDTHAWGGSVENEASFSSLKYIRKWRYISSQTYILY